MLALNVLLATTTCAMAADQMPPRSIRHSDVVFMYDNPKLYEAYGCTVLGWAGGGSRERIEAAHAKGVRLFAVSVGFRTEGNQVIDFSPDFLEAACRNFDDKPFIVPWLWDHKHKGQPYWWWCTNSPLYRKYLESRLKEVVASEADALHIDDYTGTAGTVTWQSGCFCRYCLAGFREYLAQRVPKERLAELGIKDLAEFDYRKFLLERGVPPAEYNQRRAGLPLAAEFLDYQVKANNEFVASYRKRAEELRGKPLFLSVNTWLRRPDELVIAPHLSYVCCEMEHQAAGRKVPTHPITVYKMADALGLPIASTASGWDWALVNEQKLPGLVRTWIALSYACGHNFMAPHRQWCYNDKKGTHWYAGPTEEYAWLYQFVRRNARLLDDYQSVAPVAVVYDNAARRKGQGNIEPICLALAEKNVPFTMVVAGDDWLDYRLTAKQLAGSSEGDRKLEGDSPVFAARKLGQSPSDRLADFRAVVVPKDISMDEPQRKLIEEAKQQGRLVVGADWQTLEKLVGAPVVVEGSSDVLAVVRAIPGKADAPVVVHLVNRRYDGQEDAVVPQKDLTLRLRSDLFPGRKFAKAVLHAPQADPQPMEVGWRESYYSVKVAQLDLWGIVEFQ
jgi:hypothetical protein